MYERHKRRRPRPKVILGFLTDARINAGLKKVDLMRRSQVSIQTIQRAEMGIAITRPLAYRLFNAVKLRHSELGLPFQYREADMEYAA